MKEFLSVLAIPHDRAWHSVSVSLLLLLSAPTTQGKCNSLVSNIDQCLSSRHLSITNFWRYIMRMNDMITKGKSESWKIWQAKRITFIWKTLTLLDFQPFGSSVVILAGKNMHKQNSWKFSLHPQKRKSCQLTIILFMIEAKIIIIIHVYHRFPYNYCG